MKKIFKNSGLPVAALLVLLSLVAGCRKDILNTVPQTSISEVSAFSTPAKILAQVNNMYSKVQSANYYGGRYILFNEQRGEEFSQNDGNASVGALIWQQNPLSTSNFVNDFWTAGYAAINAVNILIANVGGTTLISNTLRDQYMAEAKFIRALSYFSLVQTYARPYQADKGASKGLPLRLAPETSAGNNDLARSSVADVYKQILKDLNEAESAIAVSYASAALNASRAHKSTVIALKTRVMLAMGDYEGVVREAKKIVSAAPFAYTEGTVTHKLEANIATVFGGSYVGGEAVFSLPFTAAEAPTTQSALAYNYCGAVVISMNTKGIASDPVFSSAASTDARRNLTALKNGQRIVTKFAKTAAPYLDYVPVIRYVEVLLNYAEAAAETGDLTTASALLTAVRQRSDAGYVFGADKTGNKEMLVQTILHERRIELLGEGHRTPDLQRRLMTLPAKEGAIGNAPAVPVTASAYIWPIPSEETSINKLCEPNP